MRLSLRYAAGDHQTGSGTKNVKVDEVLQPGAVQPGVENDYPEYNPAEAPLVATPKTFWQRVSPVIACGAGKLPNLRVRV